jgi:TRAP-type C4-dicarboxylate transport system substrate-binding protein
MSEQRFWRMRTRVAAGAALLLTTCGAGQQVASGGDDKAGGDSDPVVLTMADATSGGHPAVQYFIDQVAELSDGSLRIDVTHEWGSFAHDYAAQIVRDTAAGEADLAWVWTHAFDTLGIDAFRALSAPMLIDSYPLQQAVIGSDIPGEMLASLDGVGVTGIAVLAEGLHKPIAVDHPLLSPADFEGIMFTTRPSTVYADAVLALGATTEVAIADERTAGLASGEIQGFEMNLSGYAGGAGANQGVAPYGAANLNLWANPIALIANPETLAELTDTQREWIMRAGAAASERSSDIVDVETELLEQLCWGGSRFANASESDLAAMREAFEPVYATLERDAQTADFIARIEELKEATDPGPALDIPADCTGVSPVAVPAADSEGAANGDQSILNGTYRWELTPGNIFTVTLEDGVWTMGHDEGDGTYTVDCDSPDCTYTVDGDRIAFHWVGLQLEFTFTADDDGTLHLEPFAGVSADDARVWTTKPWERID